MPTTAYRATVDTRRGVPFERKVALLQEIDGDVMQQRSEPYTFALSRRSAHGCQPVRRGIPALCPGRGRLTAVPLGRGPSLHGLRRGNALIVRPLHRYYSLVRLLIRVHAHRSAFAFMSRSGMPCRTRMRPPRFRTKDVSTCMGSPTARGSSIRKPLARGGCCLLVSELDRHLGIRPVSQLDTQPVVSPVNASRLPSRAETSCITRGRGGWLSLTPWKTCTSYPLPAFLAHSAYGSDRPLSYHGYQSRAYYRPYRSLYACAPYYRRSYSY